MSDCYREIGCDATRAICAALGADAQGDLPCSVAAAAKLDYGHDAVAIANMAAGAGCFADAMGWLAGIPDPLRQEAADQGLIMMQAVCEGGGVAARDQPGLLASAALLHVTTKCLAR